VFILSVRIIVLNTHFILLHRYGIQYYLITLYFTAQNMAELAPLPEIPLVVPVAEIIPPVPRTIEDALIYCGFTELQAAIAVDQGPDACLVIALMTPKQIDKLDELNRPPAVRIVQEVRLSASHKLLVFMQWLLEAYDLRLDLATVDLDLLT
jgi:hypothetical protein